MDSSLRIELPQFHFPELEILFRHDVRIPMDEMEKLLQLEREPLVADLVQILNHLPKWQAEFLPDADFESQALPPDRSFALHALSLLGEIRQAETLPSLFHLLRQDQEFMDLWLGNFLAESFWEILFRVGGHHLHKLGSHLLEDFPAKEARPALLDSLVQIAWHQPVRRQDVFGEFQKLLDAIEAGTSPHNPDFLGRLFRRLTDLRATQFMPQLKRIFEQHPIETSISGEWWKIEEDMHGYVNSVAKRPLFDLQGRYAHLVATLFPSNEENLYNAVSIDGVSPTRPRRGPRVVHSSTGRPFQRKHAKVGRNDPCPCGSGKKYKKCHGK